MVQDQGADSEHAEVLDVKEEVQSHKSVVNRTVVGQIGANGHHVLHHVVMEMSVDNKLIV